jgi:ribosomal protein S27E
MADEELFKGPEGDPTLKAALKALEDAKNANAGLSARIGASSLGHECARNGWMSLRWATQFHMDASGVLITNDGHRSEVVMADIIRGVPGLEVWTEDPEKPGKQISFDHLVDGHFIGKLDGIVLGLYQAPKTPHVWEAKAVNEKKFNKLKKDVEKYGEKNALEQWDFTYFVQAQMYMMGMNLTRHYLWVSTPGCRDIFTVRTDYQPKQAEIFEKKARRIAFENFIPPRISTDPAFFKCKFCDHGETCHGSKLPQINCRTCAHVDVKPGGSWGCSKWGVTLTYNAQKNGCRSHRFHPDLVPGEVLVKGESMTDNETPAIVYKLRNETGFRDDEKIGRPEVPTNSGLVGTNPEPGDLYCSGCGFLPNAEANEGEQCAWCSGAFEVAR